MAPQNGAVLLPVTFGALYDHLCWVSSKNRVAKSGEKQVHADSSLLIVMVTRGITVPLYGLGVYCHPVLLEQCSCWNHKRNCLAHPRITQTVRQQMWGKIRHVHAVFQDMPPVYPIGACAPCEAFLTFSPLLACCSFYTLLLYCAVALKYLYWALQLRAYHNLSVPL